ncbi:MAG: cyclase family protein [Synergistaceae bacterium]|jgi:kynurenine formamidase|nr:cyclase family protein [Synergistaceae bacterium]
MSVQYREIIDLTLGIVSNMSVPPGNRKTLPPVEFRLYSDASKDGIQVGFYQQGIHAGTHLDAPRHIVPGGKTIDELPLDYFMGKGYCINCTAVKPNEPVTAAMLDYASSKIKKGMMAFLYTGWSDKMFGQDAYWNDSPFLGEDAAQWLVDHGTKIAGFDFFQEIGAKQPVLNPALFKVHKILLEHGCLNIEHLTNLGKVVDSIFDVIALPLKIIGAEGSPTRVLALRD